ncbi:S-S bond formation pathway protein, partial [Monkeypox virus]
IRRVLT